jgi:hypothetical protein
VPGGRANTNTNIGARAPARANAQQAAAGDDWAEYEQYYRRAYREASYFSSGRGWADYAPAFRYGYENYDRHRGRRFEEVEAQLESGWATGRAKSRLVWAEARGAVHDIWRRIDQDAAGEREAAAARG